MKRVTYFTILAIILGSILNGCVPTSTVAPTITPEIITNPQATLLVATPLIRATPFNLAMPTATATRRIDTTLPATPVPITTRMSINSDTLRQVIPGVTTQGEVLATFGEPAEKHDISFFGNYEKWDYPRESKDRHNIEIVFSEGGTVLYTHIVFELEEQYTFRELVERYGRPDLILGSFEEGNLQARLYSWHFVYLRVGLQVAAGHPDGTYPRLILDEGVGSEYWFEPMSEETYRETFGKKWFGVLEQQEIDPAAVFEP